MATPIQFIREQIANAAIDPSKLDLATSGITYDYSSVALQATTQSQGDDDVNVATTSYVDTAVGNVTVSAGAGIDVSANKISVDIDLASSGLTFAGTGDARKLEAAINPTDADKKGLHVGVDGYLAIRTGDAEGFQFTAGGDLQLKLKTNGNLELDGTSGLQVLIESDSGIVGGASGLGLNLDAAVLEVDATDGLRIVAGSIDSNLLGTNAVTNAKIGNDAVGINEMAMLSHYEEFTANGSTAAFTVAESKIEYVEMAQVFKNGQRMSFVTGTPGNDEYSIATNVITFGANVTNGAIIQVAYFSAGTPV